MHLTLLTVGHLIFLHIKFGHDDILTLHHFYRNQCPTDAAAAPAPVLSTQTSSDADAHENATYFEQPHTLICHNIRHNIIPDTT